MGPLSHIRVLDLSRVLAGPWATQLLADYGAEVIKVERPGAGDDTRSWGPPFLETAAGEDKERSAYYLAANRGKKSIAIDITSAKGQAQIRDLARTADILVENFKVGGLAKYGLDYTSLSALNPALIYCSITGFGQTGPYAHRPGYDFLIQAMGGMMSITGEADGRPGGGPQKVGVAVADLFTGMYANSAILAALAHRDRTGEGQHIDLALLDCQVAMLANQASYHLISGAPPPRLGNAHPTVVPYQVFECADGHLIVAIGNDGQFQNFAKAVNRPDLAGDPDFARNEGRVRNRERLIPLMEQIMRECTIADWMVLLEAAGVPFGPVATMDQVFDNPQLQARGMERRFIEADGTEIPYVANPVRFSKTPVGETHAPPRVGQHTEEILKEFASS